MRLRRLHALGIDVFQGGPRNGNGRLARLGVGLAVLFVFAWLATAAAAFEAMPDEPILFSADRLTYDPATAITTATGNVEVTQGPRTLLADKIVYYENENRVVAEGNVTLLEPTGEVVFADYFDVTGDLRTGFLDNVRAILADGTRIAASGGQRSDGNLTRLAKAVYSPCFVCEDDPEEPPLWQITAVRVTHDQQEREIIFEDAFLEIAGVPVLYLPYLSRPDPMVERKTGVLIPRFGTSSDLGAVVQVPFFWAITPHSDATITPWYTFQEGPLLQVDYRHLFKNSEIEFESSITRDSRQRIRGHFFGEARHDIDDNWRAGLDLNGSKGRTFLRRYDFDNSRTLTSRAFAEAFYGRDYFVANGYAFQGLDEDDDQDEIPFVLPLIDYFGITDPDPWGGRADFRFNTALLERIDVDATDTRRVSARGSYELPFVGPIGNTFKLFADVFADGYYADNVVSRDGEDVSDGFSGRFFPQAGARWSLPLVRDDESFQQVIEPIFEGIVAPRFGNSDRIPNEDSLGLELDETNILSRNRPPGLDRVEEGPRLNYGVRWNFFSGDSARAEVFVGQTYRFFEDKDLDRATGLDENFSDYIGAVRLAYRDNIDISYRNRIDRKEFEARRHELIASLGVDAFDIDVTYVLFEDDATRDFDGREEVQYEVGTQLSRYWRNETFGTRDLADGGGQLEIGTRLIYEDECFLFEFEYTRSDIEDDDIEQTDEFFFRIGLKTIGDFGTGFKSAGGNIGR